MNKKPNFYTVVHILTFILCISIVSSSPVQAQTPTPQPNQGDVLASLQNPILDRLSGILPVVLYGQEVSLEQPTTGIVLIAAQKASINAAVGKDVYALTLDLQINAPVGGKVMALTTMAQSNTPTRFTMYSPFAVARMIAQEVMRPASESGQLTAQEASVAAQLQTAKEAVKATAQERIATESAQLQASIAAQIQNTRGEVKQSVTEQIQQKLQELTAKLPGLFLNQTNRPNIINDTLTAPTTTTSGEVNGTGSAQPTQSSWNFSLVKPVMAQTTETTETTTEVGEASPQPIVEFADQPVMDINWKAVGSFLTKLSTIVVSSWLLLLLLPRFAGNTRDALRSAPVASIAWGFIGLITIPFASLLLLFTIVGIPMGLILLFLYAIGLMAAGWIVALTIGEWLSQVMSRRWPKHKWLRNPYIYAVDGAIVVAIATSLPGIGWIFGFLTLLAGFGSCILWAKSWRRSAKVVQS